MSSPSGVQMNCTNQIITIRSVYGSHSSRPESLHSYTGDDWLTPIIAPEFYSLHAGIEKENKVCVRFLCGTSSYDKQTVHFKLTIQVYKSCISQQRRPTVGVCASTPERSLVSANETGNEMKMLVKFYFNLGLHYSDICHFARESSPLHCFWKTQFTKKWVTCMSRD